MWHEHACSEPQPSIIIPPRPNTNSRATARRQSQIKSLHKVLLTSDILVEVFFLLPNDKELNIRIDKRQMIFSQ